MDIDGGKDLVTVKGFMEVKELVPYLSEKLKRDVEVVPPKKEDDKKDKDGSAGGGDKKENKEAGGGDKKDGGGDGGKKEEAAAAAKAEVNKMEYHGHPPQPPMYWYNGNFQGQTSYAMEVHPAYANHGYHQMEPGYMNHQGYVNQGYHVEPAVPFYMNPNHPHPQMFSDENPNACSVM